MEQRTTAAIYHALSVPSCHINDRHENSHLPWIPISNVRGLYRCPFSIFGVRPQL